MVEIACIEIYLAKTNIQQDEIKNIKNEWEQLNNRLSKAKNYYYPATLMVQTIKK